MIGEHTYFYYLFIYFKYLINNFAIYANVFIYLFKLIDFFIINFNTIESAEDSSSIPIKLIKDW